MPFSSGHEISSVCCTLLPTVSAGVEHGNYACKHTNLKRPGPAPPPPPPPPPKTSAAPCNHGSMRRERSSDEDRNSAPMQESVRVSPTGDAQAENWQTRCGHLPMYPTLNQPTRDSDSDPAQHHILHDTGMAHSAGSNPPSPGQIVAGDCVQSFWPQFSQQDGTKLVCKEFLWVPSTLYSTDDASATSATAVHLLSVMQTHIHPSPGRSEKRCVPSIHSYVSHAWTS